MDKSLIKSQVKQAYFNAKEYPDLLERFKHEIQTVIDNHVPREVTKPWHVSADIDTLRKQSKANGYKVSGFLGLVANYIMMIVQKVEDHSRKQSQSIDIKELFENFESLEPDED